MVEWSRSLACHVAIVAQSNLRRATNAEVMEYFQNTWDLTDTLFSALRDDSVFYAIPDKLRRPLIFYFAHPAAVYANKMHLAGLMGQWLSIPWAPSLPPPTVLHAHVCSCCSCGGWLRSLCVGHRLLSVQTHLALVAPWFWACVSHRVEVRARAA